MIYDKLYVFGSSLHVIDLSATSSRGGRELGKGWDRVVAACGDRFQACRVIGHVIHRSHALLAVCVCGPRLAFTRWGPPKVCWGYCTRVLGLLYTCHVLGHASLSPRESHALITHSNVVLSASSCKKVDILHHFAPFCTDSIFSNMCSLVLLGAPTGTDPRFNQGLHASFGGADT